jgi:pimeloyl-ACP methyl ester carboxylesterase
MVSRVAEPIVTLLSYLLDGAFRRVALRCFGDPQAPPLVCVHGLTRNACDFDVIAAALSDRYYVVCPDLPGRGGSDWLDSALYTPATYLVVLAHLFARLGRQVDYIGTSLGGICGMQIAALAGQPIRRMVLNDVGPFIPRAALERIRDYLQVRPPYFADVEAVRLYLRRVHAPFGKLSDAQWRAMARDSARALPGGGMTLHYDPAIAAPYGAEPMRDMDLWAVWAAIDIPLLTLRGESSDVLPEAVLAVMAHKSATVTVADTGHAPALLDGPTIAAVRAFLLAG